PLVAGPIAGTAGLLFAIFVVRHARVIEREDEALRWAKVNRDGEARCTGAWRSLRETGTRVSDPRHPYAEDLDLFGQGSLFHRLSVAHPRFGQAALAEYLKSPAAPAQIRARQAAVRALAPKLEFRQRLEALSIAVVDDKTPRRANKPPPEPPDPEPLLR